MASRRAVASSSLWPPERKATPGTAGGTHAFSTASVRLATVSTEHVWPLVLPQTTMFGFSTMPSSATRCSNSSWNTVSRVSLVTASQRSMSWAPSIGTSGERVGVGLDRAPGGNALADVDHRPPLGEAGALRMVALEAFAQTVEALGDGLCGEAGQRLGSLVDLDARHGAGALDQLHQRRGISIGGALVERLFVEDHAGDVVPHRVVRPEQHLAVVAPALLRRLKTYGIEALLDRAGGFVRGEDALAGGHKRLGDCIQGRQIHRHASSSSFLLKPSTLR